MTSKASQIAHQWLQNADAVLVTASNGLSISEGLNLFANNQRFHDVLGNLVNKYHLTSLLAAFSFPYPNQLDRWRAYARVAEYYNYNYQPSQYMTDIKALINNKPYFVWTSNVDHHFALAGFNHLLEIEGNWQTGICSAHPKEHEIVDLRNQLHQIYQKDQNGTLTKADIPTCSHCSASLTLNLAGKQFQINQKQVAAFEKFIQQYQDKKLVVLELGIGPQNQMIKAPSMQLVAANPQSHYITINKGQLLIPGQIADRSIGYSATIQAAFRELKSGQSYGAATQDPQKPRPKLTPKEQKQQDQLMQHFYPYYMVDQGLQPGSLPIYLTIDRDHPSYFHMVEYGQSWMYDMGDAAIVHCITQKGHYYQVRLGLNKKRGETHAFYTDPGTFVAVEDALDNSAGFSVINTSIPTSGSGEIMVPRKGKMIEALPEQKAIIERLTLSDDKVK